MWIVTDTGFFSVVKASGGNDGALSIRGRVKADLEGLRRKHLPGAGPVIDQNRADYPYSMRVSAAEFGEALDRIVNDIDYEDFRSTVEKRQGWIRHDIYEQVRSILRQLYCCDQDSDREIVAV
jgi:hypothetical protein